MRGAPMKKHFFVIMFILFCPALALGDGEARFSKEFQACLDNTRGGAGEMLDCIHTENDLHDKRLNAAYLELMKILPEDRKQSLRAAQRAWIKFRQSYADFLINPDGGTMNIVMRADSFLELTADQADLLEAELARARERE